jgi:rhodanese-related sulfurtransferase
MFGLFRRAAVPELTPEEVAKGLASDDIILVDIRERSETAVERIPGAVLLPGSSFDVAKLPDPGTRALVFSCALGFRSIKACQIAQSAGLPRVAHLAGGLKAWKAAGFPTES